MSWGRPYIQKIEVKEFFILKQQETKSKIELITIILLPPVVRLSLFLSLHRFNQLFCFCVMRINAKFISWVRSHFMDT